MARSDRLADADVAADLKASLAARHELGAGMDDLVLEAFLARVEERIDERVAGQVARQEKARPPVRRSQSKTNPAEVVGASMGIGLPMVIFGGIWGHEIGIVAVMIGIVIINVLWAAASFLPHHE